MRAACLARLIFLCYKEQGGHVDIVLVPKL